MAEEANLLVTYDPAHAGRAEEEVKALLEAVGASAQWLKSDVEGVFLLRTSGDAKAVVKRLVATAQKDPSAFQYTFHWVPIEKWTTSKLSDMLAVMKEFDSKMDPAKKWKMDVVKRHYEEYSTPELIIKLTDVINKPKVDLKNPEVIVRVEIIGKKAGCSLLSTNELLEVPKLKKG
jgi:tRNA(Ser,Leu) C12 N-acetylase TAN1